MERHHVDSSMASEIGYDAESLTLEIKFNSGEVYQYYDLPENIYHELLSGSIGNYFQNHIRGVYRENKVI